MIHQMERTLNIWVSIIILMMTFFDKKTVQLLQNLHFHRNVLKFILGWITIFDAKISAIKTNVNDTPYNPKCGVSTIVPFKTLITQHQDWFLLRHMAKKDTEFIQDGKSSSILCWLYDTSNTKETWDPWIEGYQKSWIGVQSSHSNDYQEWVKKK